MSSTPPIYDWMQASEIEFREKAEENFLKATSHAGFTDITAYEAMQLGHSSIVYKFQTNRGTFICKLADTDKFSDDQRFYKICEENGIKSLKVINSVKADEKLFAIFLDFVPEKTLSESSSTEVLLARKYYQMGQILAKLHMVRAKGFGTLIERKFEGVNDDFLKPMKVRYFNPEFLSILRGELEESDINVVGDSMEYLDSLFKIGELGSLCHMDFSRSNTFDTSPLTIFDPGNVSISHPMLDLGLFILYESTSERFPEIYRQIVEGYTSVTNIDRRALSAGVIVMAYRKMVTAIRKENLRRKNAYKALLKEEIVRFK